MSRIAEKLDKMIENFIGLTALVIFGGGLAVLPIAVEVLVYFLFVSRGLTLFSILIFVSISFIDFILAYLIYYHIFYEAYKDWRISNG